MIDRTLQQRILDGKITNKHDFLEFFYGKNYSSRLPGLYDLFEFKDNRFLDYWREDQILSLKINSVKNCYYLLDALDFAHVIVFCIEFKVWRIADLLVYWDKNYQCWKQSPQLPTFLSVTTDPLRTKLFLEKCVTVQEFLVMDRFIDE